MKKFILFLLSAALISSCNSNEETIDLLENISRWRGNSEPVIVEEYLVMEGEYNSFTYNPGLFKTFVNFELTAQLLTAPGASAALLFHTNKKYPDLGYEVRIDNSKTGDWDRLIKTGSLSTIRNVFYTMVEDNEWFELKVKVVENHITIHVNGYPVVDYIEPEMPFRIAGNSKRRLNAGTFALHTLYGNTELKIRSIDVTQLPKSEEIKNENPDFTRKITEFHCRTFPLVDFHVHEKGDLTLPLLIERSAKLGINYGIAANCGLKFPIQTDEELRNYQASIKGLPIFKAMQAEGREWVDMFSPELISEFDYAFTDAMTWTNKKGDRMRLWIPEETVVGDPEDFMEQLVSQIEKVVTEPIAIYVNPTYLPAELESRYDELWTDERIDRVVKALVDNDVALEINSRLRLPSGKVIAKAKAAGVKFAMGTNNTDSENLGRLEWALDMVDQYEIQPADMFIPDKNK